MQQLLLRMDDVSGVRMERDDNALTPDSPGRLHDIPDNHFMPLMHAIEGADCNDGIRKFGQPVQVFKDTHAGKNKQLRL